MTMLFDPTLPPNPPAWSHKAWMSVRDADILETLLVMLQPHRVLEWGAGRSTVWYPRVIARSAQWTTIEHDVRFAGDVAAWAPPNVDVLCVELGAAYVHGSGSGAVDLAIVDGRLRRRCLLRAAEVARLVVLHDAQRPYYHAAFEAYAHHAFVGDALWIGAQDPAHFERAQALTVLR